MKIDLSDRELEKHIDVYHALENKPSFSICVDIDLHVLFFKRKDKYYGIRSGKKADFESRAEFLVNSFLIEKIRAHVKPNLILENLTAVDCSLGELNNIFTRARKIKKSLPNIDDILSAHTIENSSELNWVFLEEESNYHSLFWNESETKLFRRCA